MILNVVMKDSNYDVIIERHSLECISKYLNLTRKVLILTDSGVPKEYSEMVKKASLDGYIYTIPMGEASKSFENFGLILDYMIKNTFSRTDCVVAVGGGVVGDLAGFVASTYMRGIDFYNIPTTLLSQVDSSIGGKTAIDKMGIKNVVGAFYPPKKVLIDSETLKTLDTRQIHSGLVEALKMGATSDLELFTLIENSSDLFSDIDEIIIKSLMVKKMVVETDPKEQGLRKILNFGHTVGHAIEASGKFNSLLHGECVGVGMLYFSSVEVREKLEKVLGKYQLPTKVDITSEELFKYINLDKKRSGDYLSIIYVKSLGNYEIRKILLEDIKKYL
ncbi:MAG: 3-dehydroquinate synthase [Bacilli bacterium]|nr:3-dehydroquinate synthase [Bacilli bacterium]